MPLYLSAGATFLTSTGEEEIRALRIPPPSATVSGLPVYTSLPCRVFVCFFLRGGCCQVRQSSEEKLFCQEGKKKSQRVAEECY